MDGIENPSLVITVCHHLASLVMPIGDPRDGFYYPKLTLMMIFIIFSSWCRGLVCGLLLSLYSWPCSPFMDALQCNVSKGAMFFLFFSDKSPVKTYSLFSTTDKVIIDTKIQIGKPGIFNNIEFPFHYARGSVWLWEIFFGQGKYVNIIFLNISLNVYSVSLLYKYTDNDKMSHDM